MSVFDSEVNSLTQNEDALISTHRWIEGDYSFVVVTEQNGCTAVTKHILDIGHGLYDQDGCIYRYDAL